MLMGAKTVTTWLEHVCSIHKALVSIMGRGEKGSGLQREEWNSTCFKGMGSEILILPKFQLYFYLGLRSEEAVICTIITTDDYV